MAFPVADGDIVAAETALGGTFPAAFRQKMAEDNGGSLRVRTDEFELFKFLDRSDRKRMARTAALDIVRENATARRWTDYPDDAIAIGSNGGGDLLVLFRSDGRLGPEVHIWDHETGSTTQVATDIAALLGG